MTVTRIVDQKLAGTRLDSQGERLTLGDLKAYCDYCQGRQVPLHQRHLMGEPTLGYIENVRLMPEALHPDEWQVLGDVTLVQGALENGLMGFSISFMAPLVERDSADTLLYLPYPQYNDGALISELSSDDRLKIGKWIKKEGISSGLALFGSVLAFVLAPAWDQFYKANIAPRVTQFLDAHLPILRSRDIKLEHVQIVLHKAHEIELRFVPEPGKEEWCLAQEPVTAGIKLVAEFLEQDLKSGDPGVQRIVLSYEIPTRSYRLLRVEYRDGSVSNV